MVPQTKIAWPVKTREMNNRVLNSSIWNDFKFRDDDVIIATYSKSGTTWMQQIVAQLIFNGAEGLDLHNLSPWLDFRHLPREDVERLEAQPHRRFIKTHLPVDALVISPKAKYLYIGRDGRDTAWSYFNHQSNVTEKAKGVQDDLPDEFGPRDPPCPDNAHEFYRMWFEGNGTFIWPFWEHVRSWWAVRDQPNVKLIHFNDLKSDLTGSIRSIAVFLGISMDEATFPKIVHHCTFDYMKANAEMMAPMRGERWKGGARTFIHKGTNGRWRDTLSKVEVAAYEARAVAELGPECAKWLAQGSEG